MKKVLKNAPCPKSQAVLRDNNGLKHMMERVKKN